jgi:hypothetical protein
MKATLMYGAGDVRVEDVPDPAIHAPTDAIVRVMRAAPPAASSPRPGRQSAVSPATAVPGPPPSTIRPSTRSPLPTGKTPAQVMIRWHLQQGRSAIPKSVRPERIAENFDVFDFELTTAELKALDALDTGVRGGPEPDDVTLEAYGRPIPEA